MRSAETIQDLNQLLINRGVETVVRHLMGDVPQRSGNYLLVGNVNGDPCKTPGELGSLAIYLNGPSAGKWVDNATDEHGDLVELWTLNKNISKGAALKEIREYLSIDEPSSFSANRKHLRVISHSEPKTSKIISEEKFEPASPKNLEYLKGRLLKHQSAMDWLTARGLDAAKVVENFGLGLLSESNGKGEILRVPLIDCDGVVTKRSAYYPVDGITSDEFGSRGKCKGSVAWSYSKARLNQKYLFICEGFKDQWMLAQQIEGTEHESNILIITSTHGTNIPEIGKQRSFYEGFDRVFLGHDNDGKADGAVKKLATALGARHRRVEVPEGYGKDWTDFFKAGGTSDQFYDILWKSSTIEVPIIECEEDSMTLEEYQIGTDYDLTSLTIAGYSYRNGFMYYPIEAMHVGTTMVKGVGAVKAYGRRIRVLRSGKPEEGIEPQLLSFARLPLMQADDISGGELWALSDDTIILDKPRAAPGSSFSRKAVNLFAERKYPERPTNELLEDIERHYRTQLYVSDDDYKLLSLITLATHCQHIFDAVPLVMATGPAGTGKSTIGTVLRGLAANAMTVSITSAASLVRSIDSNRGFIVIDDLEEVAKAGMGEIAQALKSSYTKETAIKRVTVMKAGEAIMQDINFFGIKFFSNTRGMDEETLSTRTLVIRTKKAPRDFKINNKVPEGALLKLRDDLHVWAFSNVTRIRDAYENFDMQARDLQIAAPLRAIAELTKNPTPYNEAIDRIMNRHVDQGDEQTPQGFLSDAVLNVYERGFDSVTIEQMQLEMQSVCPPNFGKESTSDIPEFLQSKWIKSQMYGLGWIGPRSNHRARVTSTRIESPKGVFEFLPAVAAMHAETRSPDDIEKVRLPGQEFCKNVTRCVDCAYGNIDCQFRFAKRSPVWADAKK